MGDKKAFAEAMALLAEVYDREVSEQLVGIYFEALRELSIEELCSAIGNLIKTRVFPSFPKPAEIIVACRGTDDDRALRAWLTALDALRRIGPWDSVRFARDPVIHSVVEAMGGWGRFCEMEKDEVPFRQKDFMQYYRLLHNEKHPEHLAGIFEIDNSEKGLLKWAKRSIVTITEQQKPLPLALGAPR